MGSCIAHRRKKTVAVKPRLAALQGKPLQQNGFYHFRNENRPHQTSTTIPKSKQPTTQSPPAIFNKENLNTVKPLRFLLFSCTNFRDITSFREIFLYVTIDFCRTKIRWNYKERHPSQSKLKRKANDRSRWLS